MLIQQTSPEKLYTHFARNITTTRTEIQDFARLLQHDRTKELFQRAEESRSQKSEDIRGWRVTEHEDWLDVRIVDTPMKTRMDGTVGSDQDISLDLTVEELRATIERFQKNRPGIDCSLDEGSETFTVYILQQRRTCWTDRVMTDEPPSTCGYTFHPEDPQRSLHTI